MKPDAEQLRERVLRLTRELAEADGALAHVVQTCQHQYGQPVYDPIHHKAYTIPGDPPGTMGVDWRGPCYVPAETIRRWKKVCTLCGDTRYTQNTRPTGEAPVFGDERT